MRTLDNVTPDEMKNLESYMNDEIREKVHFQFAPCSDEKFLQEYVKADEEFITVLNEFGLEVPMSSTHA